MRIFYIALCGLFFTHFVTAQNCPPRPAASLKLLNNDICIGRPISVLNLSNANGNDVYYVWEWGDGSKPDTIEDTRTPVHIYERAANDACQQPYNGFAYKIKLSAINRNGGCLNHATVTDAYAYFTPVADFKTADVCIDQPIAYFQNTTCALTTPGTRIFWNFGDPASGNNNTSTETNPNHRYGQIGTYEATLTVMSMCDTTVKKITVNVHGVPNIGFTFPNTSAEKTVCAPYELPISNTSQGITGGLWKIEPAMGWSFAQGTHLYSMNPIIRFEKNGEYTITYEANTACGMRPYVNTQKVVVRSKPEITIDTLPKVCVPYSVIPKGNVWNDGGLPLKFSWTITGGSISTASSLNPGSINFTNKGSFPITFQAENACGVATKTEYVTTVDKVQVTIAPVQDTVCAVGSPVQLKALPEGGKWTGNGITPEGLFDPTTVNEGEHILKYSVSAGSCSDTKSVALTVFGSEKDTLPAQFICSNPGTVFSLQSSGASQRAVATNGRWTGAGVIDAVSGLFDPSVSGIGTFKMTYTYSDFFTGCPSTVSQDMIVNPKPKSQIDHIPTFCANNPTKFLHKAEGASQYKWDFGDGNTSTTEKPTYSYTREGDYTLKLITTNDKNCTDTAKMRISILAPLKAEIAQDNLEGCTPLSVKFQNKTTAPNARYTWDFGNGKTSTDENPASDLIFENKTYKDTQYVVKLTVAKDGCASASTTTNITVSSLPNAEFGVNISAGCAPLDVQFANVSAGSPRTYLWNFGNGRTSTEANPNIETFGAGAGNTVKEYTVQLITSNLCGQDTAEQKIKVKPSETKAFFGLDKIEGCAPLSINVTGTVTQGAVVQYDLGDGTLSNQKNLKHTFSKPGTYKIRQMASGSCGRDSIERLVYVWDTPSAKFTTAQTNGCKDRRIQFSQTTTRNVSVEWDMGDSTILNATNPLHDYGQKGTYMVKLSLHDMVHGCHNKDSMLVEVRSPLSFSFDSIRHSGCYGISTGAIVVRKEEVKNATGIIEFSLNDSTFTKDINLSGVFSSLEGRRWHTIWVRDKAGCVDSASAYIKGFPSLALDAGEDKYIELGDSVHAAVTTNAYKLTNIKWTPSGSVSCDTCDDVWLAPIESTNYTITATGPEGCTAETHLTVHVGNHHKVFVPNVFSPNGDGLNDYFFPYVTKQIKTISYFKVFTRWGEQVFENTNFKTESEKVGWDGVFRSDRAQQGVYVWVMEVELLNGNRELYKGDVTLMR